MRFGKRLVEVTQNGRANAPYISYKDLKHTLGVLSRLIGSGGGDDDDDAGSSDDAAVPRLTAAALSRASDTGSIGLQGPDTLTAPTALVPAVAASCSADIAGRKRAGSARLDTHQREFFERIDSDVTQAVGHVQGGVATLEVTLGEWQMCAMDAGLLYTPEKLEQVSDELGFRVEDKSILMEWLTGLRPPPEAGRRELIEKFAGISAQVNSLMQYIEVNLTAVRKILKKFEKKVPAELRMRSASDYRAHYGIFTPSMQHLLETTAHMQRLVTELAQGLGPEGAARLPTISPLAPECATALSRSARGGGSSALEDLLSISQPASRIDVYAKPVTDGCCPGTASLAPRKPANQPNACGAQQAASASTAGAYPAALELRATSSAPQQAPARAPHVGSGSAGGGPAPQGAEPRTGQGRRRGGQRGGGRGRRAAAGSEAATPVGAGASGAAGSASASAAGAAWAPSAEAGVAATGSGSIGVAFGSALVPQPCFTQVPAYVGQDGPFRGWPAMVAGRGEGGKAPAGKGCGGRGGGLAHPGGQVAGSTAGGKDRNANACGPAFAVGGLMGVGVGGLSQSTALDPTWLAAMMPMIWSGQGGMQMPADFGG